MKQKNFIITVLLVALLGLAIWFLQSPNTTPEERSEPNLTVQSDLEGDELTSEEVKRKFVEQDEINYPPSKQTSIGELAKATWTHPIEFYGKVIDEKGEPIEGAEVRYKPNTAPWSSNNPTFKDKSDANGLFSISGLKGAALYVDVIKDGYYFISGKSSGNIGYGVPTDRKIPTKDNPTVFMLKKKGEAEQLLKWSKHFKDLEGKLTGIDLEAGKVVSKDQADVLIELKTRNKTLNGRFEWEASITIPGGGFVEREDTLQFKAPSSGYREQLSGKHPPLDQNFMDGIYGEYFMKLRDGKFARARIRLAARQGVASFEIYLNPSGSRNLEYDPTLAVKP